VTDIQRQGGEDGQFLLTTRPHAGEAQYRVDKLILATGGTARARSLGIPGENLPHVSHYFADPHEYFGQRLHIIGGKNSAVEAALRAQQAGALVSMSHRRPEFDSARIKYWLWPEISGLIQSGRIPVHFNSRPVLIRPDRVILEQERIGRIEVPADFVLALIGYEADMTLFLRAGVELIGPGEVPKYNPNTMETTVPGLFVAGTATAGTQNRFGVFIENCHVHVDRIMASLTGHTPPAAPSPLERPESC
jgi:thioredoxin reductase (NADPH)